jgi:SAM-dependent methyltransferase
MAFHWQKFYDKPAPESRWLRKALGFPCERGSALDLGAGTLRESRMLLEAGFGHVLAIDSSAGAAEAARQAPNSRLRFLRADFGSYHLSPNSFDLVHAKSSLFFLQAGLLARLLGSIHGGVRPGGLFVADFLGTKDSWKDRAEITCLPAEELLFLLRDWEILSFFDTEFDEADARGESKHWHFLKVIARKPLLSRGLSLVGAGL